MNHMQVPAALKARVAARVEECIKKAGVNLPKVNIAYDINSARLGGQANYAKNLIRINPVFLKEYTDDYIENTVGHEAAHLIARAKYGRMISAHGPEWKRTMRELGLQPDRCHSYKVPDAIKQNVGKQVQKHACSCDRCGESFEVGPKVRSKLERGYTYTHKRCGGKISLPLKLSGNMISVPTTKALAHTVPPAAPMKVGSSSGSKLDQCRAIYRANKNTTRDTPRSAIIDLFVKQAGCTPAGAATYYAKISKE